MILFENKILVINAIALSHGGGESILNEFIQNLDCKIKIYAFISNDLYVDDLSKRDSLFLIRKKRLNILSRIYWDFHGLKKEIRKLKISDNYTFISLQNTTAKVDTKDKYVYLHQAIPFSPYSWSLFKKRERSLFFYKYIYHYFIFLYNDDNTIFIVQTNWLKKILERKVSNRIIVLKPVFFQNVSVDSNIIYSHQKNKNDIFNLIYPANDAVYKNHIVLINAMKIIKTRAPDVFDKINIIFTVNKNSNVYIDVVNAEIENSFTFTGRLSRVDLINLYRDCNCLLFPSYIESFGLPLIESQSLNMSIIASDIEVFRDVMYGYKNCEFVEPFNTEKWASVIINYVNFGVDNE
ncbi:TPA: glycosyltransferase [Photobacterium damselae]